MHIDFADIEKMSLAELDDLRHQLRITKSKFCELGGFDRSTYSRWMRHVRGEPDGSAPQPRSMTIMRDVLKHEAAQRAQPKAAPAQSSAAA